MKRDRVIRLALLALLVLSTGLTIGMHPLAQQSQGDLHDLAKQNGGNLVKGFKADRSVIYADLAELAKRSVAIVIGRALASRAHLTADGEFITTDYQVAVQEVVKGNLQRGSVAQVSLPGGGHRFSDGTNAYLYATNYRQARKGGTYVFFLDKKGAVTRGYELAGGIQGQFELDFGNGKVIPGDTMPTDPVVKKYKNKSIKEFLVELHRAVGKGKQ